MRSAALLFRNASGAFYYDRWKPIIEGVCNLVLSLLFVQIFPESLRVVGVIAATIITTLVICDIIDPYVVYAHVFKKKPWRYCIRNYAYIVCFVMGLYIMDLLIQKTRNDFSGIVINGCISVLISLGILIIVAIIDKKFRRDVFELRGFIFNLIKRRQKQC